jgi:hypothetical protein
MTHTNPEMVMGAVMFLAFSFFTALILLGAIMSQNSEE